MQKLKITIPENQKDRLDKALVAAFPDYSRARLQNLIAEGHVAVNGTVIKLPSRALKGGEEITLSVPTAAPATPKAEAIELDVVYEDKDIIVINKPAGMVVHPAAGHGSGTLVNALLAHCGKSLSGIGGVARPGIVHRLDKDTSGLLVVAKNDKAHAGLTKQFAEASLARAVVPSEAGNRANGEKIKKISRIYTAFIWGLPPAKAGRIDAAIGRSPSKSSAARKKMAVRAGGKKAVTHYTAEEVFGTRASRLSCQLETGRTHQIRVHLTHIGCSLIGDPVYGKAKGQKQALLKLSSSLISHASTLINFPRQALHAAELSFTHPISGKQMHLKAPLPDDLKELQKALKALAKI